MPAKPRIGIGKLARQRAQIAVLGDELASAENFRGGDRRAPHARRRGREVSATIVLVLLGLERAGAIDQRAAGLGQRAARVDQAALQRRTSVAMSAALLSHGTSGWRRMVPVEEHGASSSTASNVCSGRHAATSAQTSSAVERQPREIFAQAVEPRRRAIDGGDVARRRRQAARSCRPARRTDRRRGVRRRRRTVAPAAPPRRPAPTMRLRQNPAARSPRHARWCAPSRSAARGRRASPPR